MSAIVIEKPVTPTEMSILADEWKTINARIRELAYGLFEKSGEARGPDSETWIRAEEQLLQVLHAAISERDGSISLEVRIAGYREEQVKVIALPAALIITAAPKLRHSRRRLADVGEKRIFQYFDLPKSIHRDSVQATFENGLLKVTAVTLAVPKAKRASAGACFHSQGDPVLLLWPSRTSGSPQGSD